MNEIDALLAQYDHPTKLEPGEFTVAEWAARNGKTPYEARGIVTRAMRAGKLKRRAVWVDGNKVYAYRLA